MSYCPKCGAQINQGQAFCSKCGFNLNTRQGNTNIQQPSEIPQAVIPQAGVTQNGVTQGSGPVYISTLNSRPAMDKSVKIGIIIGSAVAAVLLILFLIGSSLTKPSRVVSDFQKAVSSNNAKQLSKVLYCSDKRVTIDEKSVSPLLTYFKDNPSSLNKLVQALNSQAADSKVSGSVFVLQNVGKKFLFFPDYRIVVKPAYIDVSTKISGAGFMLESKSIGKSDSDNFTKEYGPYIPGEYNFTASYTGKYVSLHEPHKIDLVSADGNKQAINVFENLTYLNISCEYSDAELFVDGKDAGVQIKDSGNFGPLNSDSIVYAVAEKDGQKIKSDTYTVGQGDDSYVYLSFENSEYDLENIEGQIKDLVNEYLNNFAYAVNYGDFSMVEPYIYPGSSLYTTQSSYVPNTYKQGITENVLSYNITSCTINDDKKSGTVTTHETYEINSNGNSSQKSFDYKYTFQYNEETQSFQLATIASN